MVCTEAGLEARIKTRLTLSFHNMIIRLAGAKVCLATEKFWHDIAFCEGLWPPPQITSRKPQRFPKELLLGAYRTMFTSRRVDDKEIQLKRQNRAFFQINGVGHECIGVAVALHLRPGYDWFYPYYRDRAFCLQMGMTPYEMFLASVGAKDDPACGGRQMPSHWGSKKLHIMTGSSPTGTRILHAVGAAEASWYFSHIQEAAELASSFHDDEIAYISLGDGASSEGEFWESLNYACGRKLPVLYVVQDNGYAISVPVDVQTAGGKISGLGPELSPSADARMRRHGFPRELRGGRQGGGIRAAAQRTGADSRPRGASVFAFAFRRRAAL